MKRIAACGIACFLVCCLLGTSTYARSSDPKEPKVKSETPAEKTQAQEKLKADMTKLVSDAKAGKLKMPAQQFPQPTRNNLSTGAKIGIIAAIAGAIVLIAVLFHVTSDN
ncbi:MAG: hypothetical protein WAQ99_23075 [Pyrinomonadaceae bacterium]